MTPTLAGIFIAAVVVAGLIYVFALTDDPPPRTNQGNEDEPQCDGEFCFHTEWKEDDA